MDVGDIRTWAPQSTVKSIVVSHGYGDAQYTLQMREFVPENGDSLHKTWRLDGVESKHFVPPYAIANTEAASVQLYAYVNNNIASFIESDTKTMYDLDDLFHSTFMAALSWCNVVPVRHNMRSLSNCSCCALTICRQSWRRLFSRMPSSSGQ